MSEIRNIINNELERQNNGIELIASENYPSREVLKVCGSILMDKYAEGYPDHRYYGGCKYIDEIEKLAISNICKLFQCNYANVQPHCGSAANMAAYHALMPNGGKILSLDLNSGGHLTHGSPVSFSSHEYEVVFYPLDETGHINYVEVERIALAEKPDVILCGYSAYPYIIDFKKFREIADKVSAYLMADIAHIAGLVATGAHPSPFPYCDIVTSTTHKTLRGPRGGIILWNREDLTKRINSSVFPYLQGGPLENMIAGKAVMAEEALQYNFKEYIDNVIMNTKTARDTLARLGCVCSDTENHLFLLNTLASFNLTGLEAQKKLEEVGITTNKNMIPGDTLSPAKTSGLRIGLAAMTSRGITTAQVVELFTMIAGYLGGCINNDYVKSVIKKITSTLLSIDFLNY